VRQRLERDGGGGDAGQIDVGLGGELGEPAYGGALMRSRPLRSAASNAASAFATLIANAFSHKRCLLASRARIDSVCVL
jgi:hypothetical protein